VRRCWGEVVPCAFGARRPPGVDAGGRPPLWVFSWVQANERFQMMWSVIRPDATWRGKIIVIVVVLVGVAVAVPSATRPTMALVVMVTAAVIEALTALLRLAVPRTVTE